MLCRGFLLLTTVLTCISQYDNPNSLFVPNPQPLYPLTFDSETIFFVIRLSHCLPNAAGRYARYATYRKGQFKFPRGSYYSTTPTQLHCIISPLSSACYKLI